MDLPLKGRDVDSTAPSQDTSEPVYVLFYCASTLNYFRVEGYM